MPPDALPMSRRTAVVMMDTRVPDLVNLARRWDATDQPMKHNVSTTLWTQFLNLKYACAHGYSLIFYQLVGHGCRHPLWGQRHPSYCKLAAVAETLAAGYGWVVCVDSDAFFQSTGSKTFLELRALLRAYGATAEDAAGNGARALFGWDAPYTLGPNAGFMVLRNSPETRELLSVWWNLRSGARGLEHPYEQHALQWRLVHLQRYPRAWRRSPCGRWTRATRTRSSTWTTTPAPRRASG